MKITLTAVALIIAATQAQAITPAQAEQCKQIGDLAEIIMQKRQEGVTISQLMAISEEEFVQSMILDAFNTRLMGYDQNKADQVLRYREKYEAACFKFIDEAA